MSEIAKPLAVLLTESVKRAHNNKLQFMPDNNPAISEPETPEAFAARLTDSGNAETFALMTGAHIKHVTGWGWMAWNGKFWERDEKAAILKSRQVAKKILAEASDQLNHARAALDNLAETEFSAGDVKNAKEQLETNFKMALAAMKWAIQSHQTNRLNALLTQAAALCAGKTDQFDANPWLVNCKNGVFDLVAGVLHPHKPEFYQTRMIEANYTPGAACPTWLEFLNTIYAGNQEIIDYVQMALGHALSGDTPELVHFCYGPGANGKSTKLETIMHVFGTYSMKLSAGVLSRSRYGGNGASDELAQAQGVRFVVLSEMSGGFLNDELLKDISGKDTITARLLYQSAVRYKPQFDLWMYGNVQPKTNPDDAGIWRRLRSIPFDVVIPEGRRDPFLQEKLIAESDGIFSWLVEGFQKWYETKRLDAPQAVMNSTNEYKTDQDGFARFVDECLVKSPSAGGATAKTVYRTYSEWHNATNDDSRLLTSNAFGRKMTAAGFESEHTSTGNSYLRMTIRDDWMPQNQKK